MNSLKYLNLQQYKIFEIIQCMYVDSLGDLCQKIQKLSLMDDRPVAVSPLHCLQVYLAWP